MLSRKPRIQDIEVVSAGNPRSSQGTSNQHRDPVTDRVRIARIVLDGRPPDSVAKAQRLLLQSFDGSWPAGMRANFTLTIGGLIHADFPVAWSGGIGWESRPTDFNALVQVATPVLKAVLSPALLELASRRTHFLTLGIDLGWSDEKHAELVATVDTASGAIAHWTGKSYPVDYQAHRLVHVVDLPSHLFEGAGEKVLVLGCHDLNLFSPRGRANLVEGSVRWQRCKKMDTLLARFAPTLVLHHPHNTDSPRIWSTAWGALRRRSSSISCWASGIAFYNGAENEAPRRPLDEVRLGTRSPDGVYDVVIDPNQPNLHAIAGYDADSPATA